MREAGLTAAQAPHGRPGSDASALQVTRACEQSEEVAWRDDAPTTPRLTRQHESTRSHLVQPRHVQTASAPTQRTDADAGDAKKGPRALRTHHDTPAQLRAVVATAYAVAVATRCSGEATFARRRRLQPHRQQPQDLGLPAAASTRRSGAETPARRVGHGTRRMSITSPGAVQRLLVKRSGSAAERQCQASAGVCPFMVGRDTLL